MLQITLTGEMQSDQSNALLSNALLASLAVYLQANDYKEIEHLAQDRMCFLRNKRRLLPGSCFLFLSAGDKAGKHQSCTNKKLDLSTRMVTSLQHYIQYSVTEESHSETTTTSCPSSSPPAWVFLTWLRLLSHYEKPN